MEQCLRIALWMFVLIGHLHAVPLDRIQKKYLFLNDLRKIKCPDGVNFTSPSPTPVPSNCYPEALRMFMDGMKHADESCVDNKGRLRQAMVTMNQTLPTTPENCNLSETHHQQFVSFVDTMDKFVQQFNSRSTKRR